MKQEERQELQNLLRELHNLSGFRLSVHDPDFRETSACPQALSDYCRLMQSTPEGLRQCEENDACAFEHVRRRPEVYLYRCRFGLYEAVAPLYLLGNLVGYLMMGQTIDGAPASRQALRQNGLRCGADPEALRQACDRVCVCSKDKILSCMKILDVCAQYITLSNRFSLSKSNIADRLKRELDERYAQRLTIADLCARLHCSRTTATRAFREAYGLSLNAYLIRIRMQTARRLLAETPDSVGSISERCGYPDQNYFCKAFLKACGQTPSAYRKARRGGSA